MRVLFGNAHVDQRPNQAPSSRTNAGPEQGHSQWTGGEHRAYTRHRQRCQSEHKAAYATHGGADPGPLSQATRAVVWRHVGCPVGVIMGYHADVIACKPVCHQIFYRTMGVSAVLK
jgi:hypothetical protein